MRLLKWTLSIFMILFAVFIIYAASKVESSESSPGIIVNSTNINSTGDMIKIDYTLLKDFYSDPESGQNLYIGFRYPDKYRGVFENQFVSVNQSSGTYSVLLPYIKGLDCNVDIMTHYEAAFGRGIDEYIYKCSYTVSTNK